MCEYMRLLLFIECLLHVLQIYGHTEFAQINHNVLNARRIEDYILSDIRNRIELHKKAPASNEGTNKIRRPFVTVTYAQSLDGSIATNDKRPYPISGTATKIMTHALRSVHDGILVGGNTVRCDNPKLNVRDWIDSTKKTYDPRPIFISSLKGLPMCFNAKGVIILTDLCREETQAMLSARTLCKNSKNRSNKSEDEEIILHCKSLSDGNIDIHECLFQLYELGFESIMIEGGGKIIRSFLLSGVVDRVVITYAPIMLSGYTLPSIESRHNQCMEFDDVQCFKIGEDIVVMATPKYSKTS